MITMIKKVLVGGCFDLLHYGHIKFLEEAKKAGDYLVVALESDENVRRMKGPTRPIHTQELRKHMLLSLKYVDEIINLSSMHSDNDYLRLVQKVKPTIIAITDGDTMKDKKEMHAKTVGARLIVIPKIHTPSTSQLAKLLELE
jgi:FAD synthetase